MQDKIKTLEQAKEVILNLSMNDFDDKEIISKVAELRSSIEDFYKIFRFPHGTKKLITKR
jgi:hypothetical protein